MRIVDTVISREGGNSAWANVVFVGDGGETVSVRLPCLAPYGSEIGRSRIVEQAMNLLLGVVSERSIEPKLTPPGRFGVVVEENGTEPGNENPPGRE